MSLTFGQYSCLDHSGLQQEAGNEQTKRHHNVQECGTWSPVCPDGPVFVCVEGEGKECPREPLEKECRRVIDKYLTVPPFDSSSRPSCGSAEHRLTVDDAVPSFTPSLAKFPICEWVEKVIKGSVRQERTFQRQRLTLKRAVMRKSGRMTNTNPQRMIWRFSSSDGGVSGVHCSREQTEGRKVSQTLGHTLSQ